MSQPHPELNHGEPRRGFLTHMFAAGIGLLVGTVPALAGLAFFLDPIVRKKKGVSGDGFLKMPVALQALEINGEPQLVKIIMDKVDAWNTYLNQPVGSVYLRRTDKDKVIAFNSRCPHLGCSVDYKSADKIYFCPCHTSTFGMDGRKQNEIPPRGLDALEVQIRNGTEVWLKFQNFRATTPDKIPVG